MKHSVDEIELKNGARGLLINVPGASVTTYELNFRAGEFLMPRAKWEVPHLMEHVIAVGGNEEYPDRQVFQAEISKNGAFTNAYTSYYYVSYVGESADFEWRRVLDLQIKSLSKPLFLNHEFEAECGNVRDELASYCNNHFRALSETLSQSFGFNLATDRQRVKLMTNVARDDLVKHYHRTHYMRNLRFVVAGNLRGRRAEVKKTLEAIGLPRGQGRHQFPLERASKPTHPTYLPNSTVENVYVIINSYQNSILSQKADDALGLVRVMLTETLYSNIFGQARDKGLVYHVSSGHHQSHKNTEWWLSAQVLPENVLRLGEIILSEVKKVQNGLIDDSVLEAAKHYALGSFQRSLQTVQSVASAYSRYFFDDHVEDISAIPERIRSISKADMAKAFRQLFSEDIGSVGILGGGDAQLAAKLYDQLQPLWRV